MAITPASAKIVDFETSIDVTSEPSAEGPVVWAEVRIEYFLSGLAPTVTVRVPVPWNESETAAERKAKALRSARELIDHACRATGVQASEAETSIIGATLDQVMPSKLEGLAQELGLAEPTTRPAKKRPRPPQP